MDMSEEDMEKLRYSLSRSGPLQEALDQCLKHLDSPTLTGTPRPPYLPRPPFHH